MPLKSFKEFIYINFNIYCIVSKINIFQLKCVADLTTTMLTVVAMPRAIA